MRIVEEAWSSGQVHFEIVRAFISMSCEAGSTHANKVFILSNTYKFLLLGSKRSHRKAVSTLRILLEKPGLFAV